MNQQRQVEIAYLTDVERSAFRQRNAAFRERISAQARYAPYDSKLSARCEAAEKLWLAAKADLAALMGLISA